jgi:hypothetical protein
MVLKQRKTVKRIVTPVIALTFDKEEIVEEEHLQLELMISS